MGAHKSMSHALYLMWLKVEGVCLLEFGILDLELKIEKVAVGQVNWRENPVCSAN